MSIPTEKYHAENQELDSPEEGGRLEHDLKELAREGTFSLLHNSNQSMQLEFQNHTESESNSSNQLPNYLPPLPQLPSGGRWSWHPHRKLRFDVSGLSSKDIPQEDLEFLAQMYDRDDIAVVSYGVAPGLDKDFWTARRILQEIGLTGFIKVIRYTPSSGGDALEKKDVLHLKSSEMLQYLDLRDTRPVPVVPETIELGGCIIDPHRDVLYAIDIPCDRLCPRLYNEFMCTFRLPFILPGGDWCMLNATPVAARPDIGPKIYMAPVGGPITFWHQDGQGTIDSGHCCIRGYNDVIMLRRLSPGKFEEALKIMGDDIPDNPLFAMERPHAPRQEAVSSPWPTKQSIEELERLNFQPCVFILEPGEHLHINKGRYHTFRKSIRQEQLPEDDCHKLLHANLKKHLKDTKLEVPGEKDPLSIAYDYSLMGSSCDSMRREISLQLDNRRRAKRLSSEPVESIPSFALLNYVSRIAPPNGAASPRGFLSATETGKAIWPALLSVIEEEMRHFAWADEMASLTEEIHFAQCSDLENQKNRAMEIGTMEPIASDYHCALCFAELANGYLLCKWCHEHNNKDVLICCKCYLPVREKGGSVIGRHVFAPLKPPTRPKAVCPSSGTGDHLICPHCQNCSTCLACFCHNHYEFHYRIYGYKDLMSLLQRYTTAINIGGKPAEVPDTELLQVYEPKGMKNDVNYCYVFSLLPGLYSLPDFLAGLEWMEEHKMLPMIQADTSSRPPAFMPPAEILSRIFHNWKNPVSPEDNPHVMITIAQYFSKNGGKVEEDARQLLDKILDCLEQCEKQSRFPDDPALLLSQKLFEVKQKSFRQCSKCKTWRSKEDVLRILDIPLPVGKDADVSAGGDDDAQDEGGPAEDEETFSLGDLIKEHLVNPREEVVKLECRACNSSEDATKQEFVCGPLPSVLLFHLRRPVTDYEEEEHHPKKQVWVTYDATLRMTVLPEDLSEHLSQDYELVAVTMWQPEKDEEEPDPACWPSHYWTCVKHDGKYFTIDDNVCQQINEKDFLSFGRKCCLFWYVRK